MQARRPSSSQRRLTRFIAWALLLLNWIATGLDHGTAADRRRLRQRHWYFDLGNLFHLVRELIIWRAGAIAKLRRPHRVHHRSIIRTQMRRRAFGARLRRALTHRDPMQMLARLTHALRNIDLYARPLAARFKRRLTRLSPRLPAPQTVCPPRVLTRPTPLVADSS
jgi:hypothetical protein